MNKKLLMILALSSLLAGCAGEMTTAEKIKAIQVKAVEICKYLPQANSIAAMLAAANPSVVGVSAVAGAICQAVTTWQAKQSTQQALVTECPKVNNVCVTGEFVNPPKGN